MNIPGSIWARYKSLMKDAHNAFNQDILIWVRHTARVLPFQEQEHESGDRVELQALMGYNFFRTWPITKHSTGGELDNQNMLVLINREYLGGLNYLNAHGYFNFKPDQDYFIHRGIKYKAEGDTFLSQAHNDPLHIQIILRREETITGQDMFNYPTVQSVIEEVIEDKLSFYDHAIPEI